MHRCPQCGLAMERDENAARNMDQKAFDRMRSNNAGPVQPELQE
ncbi:MAG: hypothetical protein ACLPX5_07395 [Dissulfurispiraceae bacterium]